MKKYGIARKYEQGDIRLARKEAMANDIVEMFEYHRLPCNAAISVLETAKKKVEATKDRLDYAYDHQSPPYQS